MDLPGSSLGVGASTQAKPDAGEQMQSSLRSAIDHLDTITHNIALLADKIVGTPPQPPGILPGIGELTPSNPTTNLCVFTLLSRLESSIGRTEAQFRRFREAQL